MTGRPRKALRRSAPAPLCLALLAVTPASAQVAKSPIQQLDMFELERGSDAQISPDGRTLAYVRATPDIRTDRTQSTIWLVDLASGAQRRLSAVSASHPRWSPDNSRIAYLANDASGRSRLFIVTPDHAGAPVALSGAGEGPGDVAWSPDGTQLAFTRPEPFVGETIPVVMPRKPAGAQWSADPIVITSPHYSHDGSAIEAPSHAALFTISSTGGEARRIATDGLDVTGRPDWTADGTALVFAAKPRSDTKGDLIPALYEAPIDGHALRRLTAGPDAASHPAVSRDGRTIAYLRYDMSHPIWQVALWLMDRNGLNQRRLKPTLDRDVQDLHWLRDGRLAFSYGDAGESTVAIAREGAASTIVTTHGDGGDFSVADTGLVGFAYGASDRPTEAGLAGPHGDRRAAPLNAALLARREVGRVVGFDAKSSIDGRRVPGWMMLPPGYRPNKRYPTILVIHGGPWGDEGPLWRADLQLLAAAGYVVVYPNPRGATSYGFAYTSLLPYDAPQADYDDLMDVVDTAVAKRIADPAHVYLTGQSYGGIMTTWIIGKNARFRAAVAEKPAVSPTANLSNDQYEAVTADPRGLPWVAPARWWTSSSISLVGNVRTPTMLIVGEEDKRTPPGEAQMFYNALQLRRVPSALVFYPGASHESLGVPRSQLISKTSYILGWFARYR